MERAWVDAVPYVKFAEFDDHGDAIVDVTRRTRSLRVMVHRCRRRTHDRPPAFWRPGRSGAANLSRPCR
jgi:hypothetical protein